MGEVGQTSEALGTKHLGVGRKGWKTLGCFDKENCGYDCVDDLVEMRGCHGEEIICFFLTKIEPCHAIAWYVATKTESIILKNPTCLPFPDVDQS